jgi:catechol 2,3-dioxygenase-like lactoylglutathione lyase family enzyme
VTTPSGTEVCRPFLPTKDLARSSAFYQALGFEKVFQGDVVIFAVGRTSFILQSYYEETWAKNTMMQVLVDDLDGWWERVVALDLPKAFDAAPPKPPKMQPWGLRVAFIYDPAGVLWHFTERRPGHPAD